VLLAPPYIVSEAEAGMIIDRLGAALDEAVASV
jgi:adenosylmethionine-8-amino-7-oxononanoate aminotransferase